MNRWVLKKFSKDTFDGLGGYVQDIKQKLQDMYVCVPHVGKSTTHRDRNLLCNQSMILSLKLVSIPLS